MDAGDATDDVVPGTGARYELPAEFRYVHAPMVAESAVPLLGHTEIVDDLVDHLRNSDGGTFLVAGFRGVGKTTVVRRAVHRLEADPDVDRVVVSVDVARPMPSTTTLMFAIVRQLFEQLVQKEYLERLDPAARHTVLVAYMRTSLSISQSSAATKERSGSLAFGSGDGIIPAVLSSVLPKLELGTKRVNSVATETSFLAYADSDVEHDFREIVRALAIPSPRPPTRRRGWWRPPPRRARPVRVIVVLDELDKLTMTDAGRSFLQEILVGLKNVLSSSMAHFVLVAGADLFDLVTDDAAHGTGVYESVFAWQTYVPCLWDGARDLVDHLVGDQLSGDDYDLLVSQLAYRARGVPRRLLHGFNELVGWSDGGPFLQLDEHDRRRGRLLHRLEQVARAMLGDVGSRQPTTLAEDRRRLAVYLVVEWVMASAGRVFEVHDVTVGVGNGPFGDDAQLDPKAVAEVLVNLTAAELLRSIGEEAAEVTHVFIARTVPAYALTNDVLGEVQALSGLPSRVLHLIVRQPRSPAVVPGPPPQPQAPSPVPYPAAWAGYPADGAHHPMTDAGPYPAYPAYPSYAAFQTDPGMPIAARSFDGVSTLQPDHATLFHSLASAVADPEPAAQPGDRYELGRRRGAGATGSVYEAVDRLDGSVVAIKMIERYSALTDPLVRARFVRELNIARSLDHPGVVRTRGWLNNPDGTFGIVMDLVSGRTIAEVTMPVPAPTAVRWAIRLCDTLQHLADRGVVRIDLKPSNVIVDGSGEPVIVDLGIAKVAGDPDRDITVTGQIVGTPNYMAPEQFTGGFVDIRADLYALGIMLFELLGGIDIRPPAESVMAAVSRTVNENVPVAQLDVSPALRSALETALRKEPDDRFGSPAAMGEALTATPEGEPDQSSPIPVLEADR